MSANLDNSSIKVYNCLALRNDVSNNLQEMALFATTTTAGKHVAITSSRTAAQPTTASNIALLQLPHSEHIANNVCGSQIKVRRRSDYAARTESADTGKLVSIWKRQSHCIHLAKVALPPPQLTTP
ncbi:unnamed protein product [Ceratitis capitata]|uniref:(Mediterranean fruit fly) hypothetical protein n=1 Tax=Ceratitis capitata TaxID=7213 RepID=A0A811UIP3_CERCA|nr:unnamed protein product [Ceratitis capitata]